MEPTFFGTANRRIYGIYQPSLVRRQRDVGVLMCYPMAQEYMRTHWAFRKLAGMLARQGFGVLRFDYYGTGDSAGESHQGSISQWCADIREATNELKDLADVKRVSLVGLRLGATLAALTSSQGLEVRDLLLWEPVVRGSAHIRELRQIERRKCQSARHSLKIFPDELLGYAFPPSMQAGVAALDLTTIPPCQADRILLFTAEERPEFDELRARLRDQRGASPHYQVVPEEADRDSEAVLLSTRILQAMTAALVEQAA